MKIFRCALFHHTNVKFPHIYLKWQNHKAKALLQHVVSVGIFSQMNDIVFCCILHDENLRLKCRFFDDRLNDTTSIFMHAQLHKIHLNQLQNNWSLCIVANVEELLHHKIAKSVIHERQQMWLNFTKQCIFTMVCCFVQFALDKFWAVMISGKFNNMCNNITQLQIWKTIFTKIFQQKWSPCMQLILIWTIAPLSTVCHFRLLYNRIHKWK